MPEATVLQAFTLFFCFPWNSNETEALKNQPCTDRVCQPLKSRKKGKNQNAIDSIMLFKENPVVFSFRGVGGIAKGKNSDVGVTSRACCWVLAPFHALSYPLRVFWVGVHTEAKCLSNWISQIIFYRWSSSNAAAKPDSQTSHSVHFAPGSAFEILE